MFLEHIIEQELLEQDPTTNVLKTFPIDVKRNLVAEINQSLLTENYNNVKNGNKNIQFSSPNHIKWVMEIIGQGLHLPISDMQLKASSLAVYSSWLFEEEKIPTILKDLKNTEFEQEFYCSLAMHLSLIFDIQDSNFFDNIDFKNPLEHPYIYSHIPLPPKDCQDVKGKALKKSNSKVISYTTMQTNSINDDSNLDNNTQNLNDTLSNLKDNLQSSVNKGSNISENADTNINTINHITINSYNENWLDLTSIAFLSSQKPKSKLGLSIHDTNEQLIDTHSELCHATLRIFSKFIKNYGNDFTENTWLTVMRILLGIVDYILRKYENNIVNTEGDNREEIKGKDNDPRSSIIINSFIPRQYQTFLKNGNITEYDENKQQADNENIGMNYLKQLCNPRKVEFINKIDVDILSNLGDKLSVHLISLLTDIWLRSNCALPPIWDTFKLYYRKWIYRVSVIQQWNSTNLGLCKNIINVLYGPTEGSSTINIIGNSASIEDLQLDKKTLFYCWKRHFDILSIPTVIDNLIPLNFEILNMGVSRMVKEFHNLNDTTKIPDGNTLLHLFGQVLFKSASINDPKFDTGRAEAIGCLCRIFGKKQNRNLFLPEYLRRFYSILNTALRNYKMHHTITSLIINSRGLFLEDLPGIRCFALQYIRMLSTILPSPKGEFISKISFTTLCKHSYKLIQLIYSLPTVLGNVINFNNYNSISRLITYDLHDDIEFNIKSKSNNYGERSILSLYDFTYNLLVEKIKNKNNLSDINKKNMIAHLKSSLGAERDLGKMLFSSLFFDQSVENSQNLINTLHYFIIESSYKSECLLKDLESNEDYLHIGCIGIATLSTKLLLEHIIAGGLCSIISIKKQLDTLEKLGKLSNIIIKECEFINKFENNENNGSSYSTIKSLILTLSRYIEILISQDLSYLPMLNEIIISAFECLATWVKKASNWITLDKPTISTVIAVFTKGISINIDSFICPVKHDIISSLVNNNPSSTTSNDIPNQSPIDTVKPTGPIWYAPNLSMGKYYHYIDGDNEKIVTRHATYSATQSILSNDTNKNKIERSSVTAYGVVKQSLANTSSSSLSTLDEKETSIPNAAQVILSVAQATTTSLKGTVCAVNFGSASSNRQKIVVGGETSVPIEFALNVALNSPIDFNINKTNNLLVEIHGNTKWQSVRKGYTAGSNESSIVYTGIPTQTVIASSSYIFMPLIAQTTIAEKEQESSTVSSPSTVRKKPKSQKNALNPQSIITKLRSHGSSNNSSVNQSTITNDQDNSEIESEHDKKNANVQSTVNSDTFSMQLLRQKTITSISAANQNETVDSSDKLNYSVKVSFGGNVGSPSPLPPVNSTLVQSTAIRNKTELNIRENCERLFHDLISNLGDEPKFTEDPIIFVNKKSNMSEWSIIKHILKCLGKENEPTFEDFDKYIKTYAIGQNNIISIIELPPIVFEKDALDILKAKQNRDSENNKENENENETESDDFNKALADTFWKLDNKLPYPTVCVIVRGPTGVSSWLTSLRYVEDQFSEVKTEKLNTTSINDNSNNLVVHPTNEESILKYVGKNVNIEDEESNYEFKFPSILSNAIPTLDNVTNSGSKYSSSDTSIIEEDLNNVINQVNEHLNTIYKRQFNWVPKDIVSPHEFLRKAWPVIKDNNGETENDGALLSKGVLSRLFIHSLGLITLRSHTFNPLDKSKLLNDHHALHPIKLTNEVLDSLKNLDNICIREGISLSVLNLPHDIFKSNDMELDSLSRILLPEDISEEFISLIHSLGWKTNVNDLKSYSGGLKRNNHRNEQYNDSLAYADETIYYSDDKTEFIYHIPYLIDAYKSINHFIPDYLKDKSISNGFKESFFNHIASNDRITILWVENSDFTFSDLNSLFIKKPSSDHNKDKNRETLTSINVNQSQLSLSSSIGNGTLIDSKPSFISSSLIYIAICRIESLPGLYRIRIHYNSEFSNNQKRNIGPLQDNCVVSRQILGKVLRDTILSAHLEIRNKLSSISAENNSTQILIPSTSSTVNGIKYLERKLEIENICNKHSPDSSRSLPSINKSVTSKSLNTNNQQFDGLKLLDYFQKYYSQILIG